jgi:hypothetical protein
MTVPNVAELNAMLREMQEHPDRVIHERLAWRAVVDMAGETADDPQFGARVRHAIAVYHQIVAEPELLVLPDVDRYTH